MLESLVAEIKRHQELYYAGTPEITDIEFDLLMDKLELLDSEHPLLVSKVGTTTIDGFVKAEHKMLMGSQSKANTESDMNKWIKNQEIGKCIVQYKMDGCLDFDTILTTDKGELTIGYIVENKINCNVKAYDIENEKVIFTGNHKVWLPELLCWRSVADLDIGDKVMITKFNMIIPCIVKNLTKNVYNPNLK